ncbi:MAG: tetratricopeptide repeat protein, partial [Deltaproteobacteria bacterium]|nr:tetratricopeptide repeat protein [Deltaproteobacteria bacterium]
MSRARDIFERVAEAQGRRLGPEHPDTLAARINLASALSSLGEHASARDLELGALEAATRIYGPFHELSANSAANLALTLESMGDPDRAVFFMKLSVEASQRSRAGISRLERELRRSFLATVEYRYRSLFGILMSRGRTAEALAVLGLLKEEELAGLDAAFPSAPGPEGPEGKEGDAGSAAAASGDRGAGAELFAGTRDGPARRTYGAAAAKSAALESERAALAEKREVGLLAAGEARRLGELPGLIAESGAAFRDICVGKSGPGWAPAEPEPGSWVAERLSARQAALSGMGSGATLLHAVSAADELWLVTVSPGTVVARKTGVKRKDLAALASEFRGLVASPSRDPRVAGAKLYDALIRPAEGDLAAAGTRSLMLSLDGELRYAPAAALWDGG